MLNSGHAGAVPFGCSPEELFRSSAGMHAMNNNKKNNPEKVIFIH
jgi:hypothetical protein